MQVKSCGAVVFRQKAGVVYYLLLKHRSGRHWSLPKGHVEKDETEAQTALREIEEESGLKVRLIPGFRKQIHYSPSPGIEKEVVFFLAKAKKQKLKLQKNEIMNAVWLEFTDSLKLVFYNDIHHVLQKAKEFLEARSLS